MPGRDLYFYVFSGRIAAGGEAFAEGEQGLLPGGGRLSLEAKAASLVVAFLVDTAAPVTRKGTVGDHPRIPPPFAIRAMKKLAPLRRLWRGK
jgi:redox-sensitive bicupin YhaK (pirin superfamily)